jgi:hypothetical protein
MHGLFIDNAKTFDSSNRRKLLQALDSALGNRDFLKKDPHQGNLGP